MVDVERKIAKKGKMKVPGVVFASDVLWEKMQQDKTAQQVMNVACLPGIVGKSLAMPDAHQGYGFCVGGVAAFDLDKGIISPGGIGYDINCGVRLLATNILEKDFLKKRGAVMKEIFEAVPSGVGKGADFSVSDAEMMQIMDRGSEWTLEKGFATKEDLQNTEDGGCIPGANAKAVSQRARARGKKQLGTIGSGNHFLEVQSVEEIFDPKVAKVFGLSKGQIVIMIHTGSRGLGHQTASDYIQKMEKIFGTKDLPDRELACAPLDSEVAKEYRGAMAAAANFAFVNRQLITHKIREILKKNFKAETKVVYDVAHNIAKFEEFVIEGKKKTLCVHRKGATRSFGPGRSELPRKYRPVGQPILIPGSMGTASYVLVGTSEAAEKSFASTAHGAGRVMSRSNAKKMLSAEKVLGELKARDVELLSASKEGWLDEAPAAYKDVDEVVRVSAEAGLGRIVARLKPVGVVKG